MIVVGALHGQAAAWVTDAYQDYFGRLVDFGRMLTHDEAVAEDLAQEIFFSAFRTLDDCAFCARSHGAVAAAQMGEAAEALQRLREHRPPPLSAKMAALLEIAARVRTGGKEVTEEVVANARHAGASDVEIHDTVLIAAAFYMFNRYVDGLGAITPDDDGAYAAMAARIVEQGYERR